MSVITLNGWIVFLQTPVDHISVYYHHSKKLYHDDENEIKRDVIGGRWPLIIAAALGFSRRRRCGLKLLLLLLRTGTIVYLTS